MARGNVQGLEVRVAREVVQTPHVASALRRIEARSYEFLSVGQTSVSTARTLYELQAQGIEPRSRTIDLPPILMRTAGELAINLFSRQMAPERSEKSNRRRLMRALEATDLSNLSAEDGPSPELLHVTGHYLIESTSRLQDPSKPNRLLPIREWSLLIDEAPPLWRMKSEHWTLHALAGKVSGRNEAQIKQTIAEDSRTNPGILPLFAISRYQNPDAVDAFIESIELDGIGAAILEADLYRPKVISVSS